MTRYYIKPRIRKQIYLINVGKILDTASKTRLDSVKTASKKAVHKTAEEKK